MTMSRDTSARSSISSASSCAPAPHLAGLATTPAPLTHQHSGSSAGGAGPGLQGPRRRISSAPDADSARELWARMLEVQERYGCYRSARMQAAVDSGQAADLMPSMACLDLLNDDVSNEELPEEAWNIFGRFVIDEGAAGSPGVL